VPNRRPRPSGVVFRSPELWTAAASNHEEAIVAQTRAIEPIRRLKVADSVAAQLEELITGGTYEVGEKLPPERVLAEQFQVGRSSMREALRMVESTGLLRTAHGIGVFVARTSRQSPSLSDLLLLDDYSVRDLFEVRTPLEGDAAALAAERITGSEVDELDAIIERMSDPQLTDSEFIELDAQFHSTVAQASQNPLLHQIVSSIAPLFVDYSHRVIIPGRRARAHAGHQKILAAVKSRKAKEARTAAVKHIQEVERDIVAEGSRAGGS
jgi:GntR family transcriptional repressor for pyruvate dehydrogenase complex